MKSIQSFFPEKNFINLFFLLITLLFIDNFQALAEEQGSVRQSDQKKLEIINQSDSKDQKKDTDKMGHKTDGVISIDATVSERNIFILIGKNNKGQASLWLQVSKDNATSWSPGIKIPIPEDLGATISRGSDAKIVKSGKTIFIVWMSHVEGARFGSGPMVAMRSLDEGKSWERVAGPADWINGPHGFFSLTSSKNTLHATWLDKRDPQLSTAGAQGLRYAYSQDGGKSWSKNITLDEVVCACCWTNTISDKDGNLYVIYRDKQPSDMAIGIISPNHSWSRLSTVGKFDWDFQGCPHIGGGLAINQKGEKKEIHAIIGTRKQGNAGIYHLMSLDVGKNWSSPKQLGDSSSTHGDITIDHKGTIYAVWDMIDPEADDGSMSIFLSYSHNGKSWTNPIKLSDKGLSASHPRIVSKGNGAVIFWTDKDGLGVSSLKIKKFARSP